MRFLVLLFLLPVAALANEPQLRGEYKNWTTYRYQEASGPMCYAMVRADKTTDAKGKKLKIKSRGQVLLQVTRRPAEGGALTVSFVAGQTMKRKSTVSAIADKGDFTLRADGDTAWTLTPADDAKVAALLRAGNWLAITHEDRKGHKVIDHFSLAGSTSAMGDIMACQ